MNLMFIKKSAPQIIKGDVFTIRDFKALYSLTAVILKQTIFSFVFEFSKY